eukprot:gene1613-1784_t
MKNLEILWKTSLLFGPVRTSWSGMMQLAHQGSHSGQSSVVFLPMIDMSSSESTCIYSTLKFVLQHAKRHQMTPIITFDQPLWWKALMIIKSEPPASDLHEIVLRLGGFHTEISFIGSIGHLMAGSGLKELLGLIYAPSAVDHILSGKAVARAVRAHLLVDASLNAIMLSNVLNVSIPGINNELIDATVENQCTEEAENITSVRSSSDLQDANTLYDDLMNQAKSAEDANEATVLDKIKEQLQKYKESVKTTALQSSRCSTWTWWIYSECSSKQSAPATGPCILNPFQKCFHILQLQATIYMLNLPDCTCSP